jgi:fatty-acyl-CoA synthase
MTAPAPPEPASPPPRTAAADIRHAGLIQARGRLAVFGVAAAAAALLLPVIAVVGVRQGWLSYAGGRGVLFGVATPAAALLAVVLGVLALVFALVVAPRRGWRVGVFALAVGALVFWGVARLNAQGRDAPPVHEVATDWRDPLMPSPGLIAARGMAANPIEAAPALPEGPQGVMGRLVAEVNAKTCPAAVPVTLVASRDAAYAKAKAALKGQGLEVVTDAPAEGRLEAVGVRGLFAQKDDVIVRVRDEGAGARIDIRSTARDGATDGGANCARLTRLRAALAG